MFLLNYSVLKVELCRALERHLIDSNIYRRYVAGVGNIIIPEQGNGYMNITTALSLGLFNCIVSTDRLCFLFGMFYIPRNVEFIMQCLIRHGIVVFADLVLQRLTVRFRRHQLQHANQVPPPVFQELHQLSRSLWGIFFDSVERNIRRYRM